MWLGRSIGNAGATRYTDAVKSPKPDAVRALTIDVVFAGRLFLKTRKKISKLFIRVLYLIHVLVLDQRTAGRSSRGRPCFDLEYKS